MQHEYFTYLEQEFHKCDGDGDGFIAEEELLKLMTDKNAAVTPSEVSAYFERADLNHDGTLLLDEFKRVVTAR